MSKIIIISILAVALMWSVRADDCEQSTPTAIVCQGREEKIYYSYNGGECRRMYGCFAWASENLYEDEDDCKTAWENC